MATRTTAQRTARKARRKMESEYRAAMTHLRANLRAGTITLEQFAMAKGALELARAEER